jgi:Tol biopolymer transport system component
MGGGFGQLAFVSDRSGVPQIYLIDADGSEVARITDLGGGACQPDWSPDGTKLVFISPCRENLQVYPNSSLQVINADGTGLSTLNTPIGSFDPDWSPDGETLLFALAADTNRVEINRYDLESETVEALTANGKLNYQPSWSNDGESLVFVSTLNGGLRLYIMDNELGAESQLFTRSGQKDNTHPSWSPNGRLVVFSQKESGIVPNIFVVSLDMLGVPSSDYRESRLTSGQIVPEQEPDFSPDGLWVAFESWPDGENHDIYVIAAGGGTQQIRLTTDPALDFDPVWRPIRPPSQ